MINKKETLKQFKSYFPDDIEAIVLTKDDYDRQMGELQEKYKKAENTEDYLIKEDIGELYKKYIKALEVAQDRFDRIQKAIEYIENNRLYKEEIDYDYEENPIYVGCNDIKARNDLLNILKGEE